MLKWLVRVAGAVAFTAAFLTPVSGQEFADNLIAHNQSPDVSWELDRPAGLTVENVTLGEALMALQRSTGLDLAFSPSALPVDETVSCMCEDVPAGTALFRILQGTESRVALVGNSVIIEPMESAGRPAGHAERPSDEGARESEEGMASDTDGAPVWEVQEGTLTGQVTDAGTGQPLQQVQVHIVGSGMGTLTGSNGRYLLTNVPVGVHQLRAERLGFSTVTQEVTVREDESVQIDFELTEQALALDEIIVTGTAGTSERREIGNTINQINVDDQISSPVSVESALQGAAPGLTVMQSTGQLGSAAQIRLRGNVSMSMSNQPLIYIDGVRMRSDPYPKNTSQGESSNRSNNDVHSPLNDLNWKDVERVEVIKGAAATTLYGTEASAGVIQIFTKRGQSGEPIWSLNIDQGFDKMRPFAPDPAPYMYMEPWLRNGHRERYNMSVRGGSQYLNYFVSGTLEDNDGVLPVDHQDQGSIRGNFGFSPLDDLQIQWNTYYTRNETRNTPTGNNSHGLTLNVYRQERNYVGGTSREDLEPLLEYDIRSQIDHFVSGMTATYTPSAAFTNRLTLGYDLSQNELRQVRPWGFIRSPEGRMSVVRFRNAILTADYVGSYELDLSDDLSATLSWGGQSVSNDESTLDGYADNFPGPSVPTLTTGSFSQSFEERLRVVNAGVFGQTVFGYHDRYFLTLGLRVDGNSAFGEDFGLQPYPKASFSYVISDEDFWPEALGEQLRLRGAYGQSGRAPGAFDAVKTWEPVGWGGRPAYFPRSQGNDELGPETTTETEVGFEGVFAEGRVTLDATYYRQRTTDALFPVEQEPSRGQFLNPQLDNVGEITNQGLEVTSNVQVINRRDWEWDLGADISTNHSEVVSLGDAPPISLGNDGWLIEGHPVPVIRGAKILNPDEIAEPELETGHFFGPNQPTLIAALHTSVTLPGNIRVSARGEYQGGNYISDGATSNAQSRAVISWPTCIDARAMVEAGQYDQLPAVERQRCVTENYVPRSHIYPADFFKLRDVSVSVPLEFLVPNVRTASLTVSARNWFRWRNDDFPIFDPEMMDNQGALGAVRGFNEQLPPPASLLASLRLVF